MYDSNEITAALIHTVSRTAIRRVTGKDAGSSWNNKGSKYRTIKINIPHLTERQLELAARYLKANFGDQFVNIRNGIAHGLSSMYCPNGFDYTKVTVKFHLLPVTETV